jgi:hypothetical protein
MRPNAQVQLRARYHRCDEAASEKRLSAATFVRWRGAAECYSMTLKTLDRRKESGSSSPIRLFAFGGGSCGYHFR